jgi:hypothetical protein
MNEPTLTPDQYAELIQKSKPYLIALEERVASIEYGDIEVRITVRAGAVEKMVFFEGKTWMRGKEEKNAKPVLDAKAKA